MAILSQYLPTSSKFVSQNSLRSFASIALKICSNIGHILKLCKVKFWSVTSPWFKNYFPLNLAIFSKDMYDFVS